MAFQQNRRRILGLSNQQPTAPLLSNFQRTTRVAPPFKKVKEPAAIGDPPVSTDEEDGQLDVQTPSSGAGTLLRRTRASKTPSEAPFKKGSELRGSPRPNVDDSSSGDELFSRGDIPSTAFTKAKQGEASNWKRQSKRKASHFEATKDMDCLQTKRPQRREYVTAKERDEAGPAAPTSSGEHFTNAHGFMQVKKSKMKYKGRHNSSQEPVTKKDKGKKILPKIKTPEDLVHPNPEKPKTKKLLVTPESLPPSPPPKALSKLVPIPDIEDIDDKTFIRTPEMLESSQESRRIGVRRKLLKKPAALDRTPSSSCAVLKIPPPSFGLELRTVPKKEVDDSLLMESFETDGSGIEELDLRGRDEGRVAADTAKIATVCPWCGAEVDTDLLEEFSEGKRLNVRLQAKFCQRHKKKTAEEVWKQKEYPRVEWDSLDKRFALHSDWLLAIINGTSSHFRKIHEKNIQTGKARSMKREGNMNPGYYGPRGFNIMCDYLVEEYGDLLKMKAIDDKVIAGRGSASFIQNVLVAELAVQMIREDMRVSEDDAIVILEESKVLGELVHEDV